MARHIGHMFIEGTINGLTYYKLNGKRYVKTKSSISKKKILESPEFENTRKNMKILGEASKIASEFYKEIDKKKKHSLMFASLVKKAKALLTEGKNKEEVLEILRRD